VITPSRASGVRAFRIAQAMTRPKKPERRRYAVTIIMPKRSTRVWASTEATASSQPITPETTMAVAPMIATPVRSTRKPGTLPRPRAA